MNLKKFLTLLIICLLSFHVFAQHNINGTFAPLAGQEVKLIGFQDFGIYTIDSTMVSNEGKFTLHYTKDDLGMGYLAAADNEAYFVVLANENTQLKGDYFSQPKNIITLSGNENKLFVQYASEHPRREQTLSAWDYLNEIYKQDSLFSAHLEPQQAIKKEKQRIKGEDNLFLASLDKDSYLKWYLPIRKLVSSVSTIAQYRPDEIPATLKAFRELDYTQERLYKSGLLKDVIEKQIWLIENSGHSLDSVYIEMNISIDYMIENLVSDTEKLNKVTGFLFKLLEKHSLFTASEHLALKVLNQETCSINNDLKSQLESYRTMKIGKTAPDFDFNGEVFATGYPSKQSPKRLSDINTKYTALIFGSSWCPACPQDLMEISRLYQKWKKQGVEVVFVSLDDDPKLFKNFAIPFPFISISDYQKWESPIVKSYHVFATPTLYLLDDKRKILLRPNSAKQLDSWVDWYLVQGNK